MLKIIYISNGVTALKSVIMTIIIYYIYNYNNGSM